MIGFDYYYFPKSEILCGSGMRFQKQSRKVHFIPRKKRYENLVMRLIRFCCISHGYAHFSQRVSEWDDGTTKQKQESEWGVENRTSEVVFHQQATNLIFFFAWYINMFQILVG